MFPELGISEAEDTNRTWYEQIKDMPDIEDKIESFRSRIRTAFVVKLTDVTKEAVLVAVAAIENNPIVAYVTPNHIVYIN